jgi:hypothetical protein
MENWMQFRPPFGGTHQQAYDPSLFAHSGSVTYAHLMPPRAKSFYPPAVFSYM